MVQRHQSNMKNMFGNGIHQIFDLLGTVYCVYLCRYVVNQQMHSGKICFNIYYIIYY